MGWNVFAAALAAFAAFFAPAIAHAAIWTDGDGITWAYAEGDDSATVTNVANAEYDVTIPASLGGKPVVSFGTVFQGNTRISSVVIPDSVTAIGANAFSGCSQLQRVAVGSNVASIGANAFRNCELLQQINLPAATTTLGTGAFAYCVKLNTAKLPGVTGIPGTTSDHSPGSIYFDGYGAFFGCDKLRTLELGANLAYIGAGAFYDCNELYDLAIPDSVTNIERYAFAECGKLHSVVVGSGVVSIGTAAFYNDVQLENLTFKGDKMRTLGASAFRNCENLQSLNLPSGLSAIGEYCFRNCDSIPSIVIPDSVTVCTNGAFAYCDGLKMVKIGAGLTHIAGAISDHSPGSIYFDGYGVFFGCSSLTNVSLNSTLRSIGRGAFYGCSALPEVIIPDSVRTIDWHAFAACGLLKDVTIGDGVRLVGECAFRGDDKLENLHLGFRVQTIQAHAFDGCTALKNFTLPDTVLTVGDYAFRNCKSVTALELPDSVGTIGVGAFAYCTGLATVGIGDGLEEITGSPSDHSPGSVYFDGYGAFFGCTALRDVAIGASVATIGRGAFYGCTALPSIELPSCVTTIGRYSFAACTSLESLDVKNGVIKIDNYAFSGDSALVTANLGNRLVTIGVRAFQNCTKLTGLELPGSLITLDDWCFLNCQSLTYIAIPDKVKDLNPGAFAYCTGIRSVKIGGTVATVSGTTSDHSPGSIYFDGYGAFYGCSSLTDLDLGTTVSEIGRGAFYGCSSLASVTIPDSVTKIGGYAFGNCASLIKATLGTGVATMGNNVFDGDKALHYVEFKGDAAPPDTGSNIFNNTNPRIAVYVKPDSTGWTGLYQSGLPETWQGARIAYAPPPAGAGNPYDFYIYPSKATVSRTDYYWSLMVTTNRYVNGRTVPLSAATIREGDTIYLSYAWDEYWRGEAFDVTNRFTLSGVKTSSFDDSASFDADSSFGYLWTTNAVPYALQNLVPGNYTLTLQLNAGNVLPETDYANNTTSITFTVVGMPRYTVSFNLNGAPGTAPASRAIIQGRAVGELPVPAAPVGWRFLGWFTASAGGTQASASSVVNENATLYAQWLKCDIGFYVPSGRNYAGPLFVTSTQGGVSNTTSFAQGTRIYLKYAFANLAGDYDMSGFVNRFALSTGATFADSWLNDTLEGSKYGYDGGVWAPAKLQNLAPGTYTLTCTLDATDALAETDETNNRRSITFTVVQETGKPVRATYIVDNTTYTTTVVFGRPWGAALPVAKKRAGLTFVGWFTGTNGTGTQVTSSTVVTEKTLCFYGYYIPTETPALRILFAAVSGAVPVNAASEYNGYLYDAAGSVKGTIQVKVGKPNKNTGVASVKATIVGPDGKKKSLKAADGGKAAIAADGPTVVVLSGGEACTVTLGENGIAGFYGGMSIDGARNLFASKDKAEQNAANAALGAQTGVVNVKFDGGTATITVGKKGKIKATIVLDNGVKELVNTQLLIGDDGCCIPVVAPKKANVAFSVWLAEDGGMAVYGLPDAVVGAVRTPAKSLEFAIEGGAAAWVKAGLPCEAKFLPVVFAFEGGAKWKFAKADTIKYKNGAFETAKDNGNPSGLKLTYKAKDGSFKGTFKAYAIVNGKLKKHTVNVTGLMIDGIGYGTAAIKKLGNVPVTIGPAK